MCNHFCSLFLRWDKIKRISNASVRSHRKAENHTTSLRLSIINPIHRTRFPFPVWEGEYFASLEDHPPCIKKGAVTKSVKTLLFSFLERSEV